jgi:hypothetical protein
MIQVIGNAGPPFRAKVTNYSGRGLALESPQSLEPGTAIRIDMEDAMILGEAVYCRQDADSWFAGIEIDQTLCGLSAIARIVQTFEDSGHDAANALEHRDCQHR